MMSSTMSLAEEARLALHGRILRCPFGGNPIECPLHEIRKLSVEKRVAWLASKSDEEVIELYELHNACLECKLENYEDGL